MLKDLLTRELAYFVVLTAVGAGFTSFLPRRIGAGTRLAFAPAFGLAVGTGLLTTVSYIVALDGALWFVLLPLGVVSVAVALRRGDALPSLRDLAQFALVTGLVFAIFNLPLHKRRSDGPIAYLVHDAPGYVHCIEGFAHHTTREPLTFGDEGSAFGPNPGPDAWKPLWNLGTRYCWYFEFQHSASMMIPAAVASSLGWYSWQALSPWMVAMVMVAGVAALGLFRVVTRSNGWLGAAAGAAAAGAPLFQPYLDGSSGILSAIALVPAVVAVVLLAVEEVDWRVTALLGLLLAGMQTVYPEVGVVVLAGTALWILARFVRQLRLHGKFAATVRSATPHLLLIAVLALAVFPRATLWLWGNAKFAKAAATADSLPDYLMAPKYIVGWVFQTRDFYTFVSGGADGFAQMMVGTALPVALLIVTLYGALRIARVRIVLAVVAAAALQALYLNRTTGCTYCVDRSFLPIMPLVGVGLAVGLGTLAMAPGRGRRELAGFLAGLFVLAAGASVVSLENRAIRGAYMPPADVRTIASTVHSKVDTTLAVEGWSQTPWFAWSENATMYAAVTQATKQRVSIVATSSEFGGYGYLRTRPPGDPSYTPDYRYVVTRFNALDDGRVLIRRTRYASLKRRAGEFDALVARGVAVDNYLRDTEGTPMLMPEPVAGPLTFHVSAKSSRRAYVRLWLGSPGLRPTTRRAVARDTRDGQSYVCMPVSGTGAGRVVELHFPAAPGNLAPFDMGPYDNDQPDVIAPFIQNAVPLKRVRVSALPCGRASKTA